jgi:4-hydroxy-tetrahydrodipicolinate synthase
MAQATNFTGTGVAIVTPFTTKGEVDFPALTKLVEHIIKGRVEYIVVLGTTGETATLSKDEKKQVIAHIIKATKKRVPLVLGVGGNNTAELVEQLKKDDLSDFDAILSVSPYYNKPSQEGIYQHYKAIAKASPLPIILYNVPGRTASNMTAETTLRLANEFKNIIAIKEASGNIEQCMKIIKYRPDNFLIISGDDNLTLPLIASGADGVISVVANAYPKDFSDMVRFALVHDLKNAQKLHYKLMEITEQLFADGNPGGVKVVLAQKKVTGSSVRLPLVEPNDAVKAKLKKIAY